MADYCELCDLPLSTCVHGMPPPPPPPPAPVRRTTSSRATSRPAATRAPRTSRPAAAAPPPPPRKLTPPDSIRPLLVAVLRDAGGHLEAEDVYGRLEQRMDGLFLERDLTTTPEGELRWRQATRKARQSLITDGTMVAGPGEWRLA